VPLTFICRYKPVEYYERLPELRKALDMINDGYFSPEEPGMFKDIFNSLVHDDRFEFAVNANLSHDFAFTS